MVKIERSSISRMEHSFLKKNMAEERPAEYRGLKMEDLAVPGLKKEGSVPGDRVAQR